MDQLICASLSHTHYWHEVGMLKVPARMKLEEFDEDEGSESCPFRELVGLMGLAISTRPDMSNAVRSVVRDWSTPKAIHWKASLGICACIHQWYFWF